MENMEIGKKLWMASRQPDRTWIKKRVVVSEKTNITFQVTDEDSNRNIALCDDEGNVITCWCRRGMEAVFLTEKECDTFLTEGGHVLQ